MVVVIHPAIIDPMMDIVKVDDLAIIITNKKRLRMLKMDIMMV
jgi:hypothetical protein